MLSSSTILLVIVTLGAKCLKGLPVSSVAFMETTSHQSLFTEDGNSVPLGEWKGERSRHNQQFFLFSCLSSGYLKDCVLNTLFWSFGNLTIVIVNFDIW